MKAVVTLNSLEQEEITRNPHRVWMPHSALHMGLERGKLTAAHDTQALRHMGLKRGAVNLLCFHPVCGYV